MSKTIIGHPGVAHCLDGEAQAFDYKYSVELKPGWVFPHGRNAGGTICNFHTVKEFLRCKPVKEK